MKKIRNALISVSNKDYLKLILDNLKKYKIKIISSGGTYKKIKQLGYDSVELSQYTNFPEILSGRVKTLHPKIHAGILSRKNNKKDAKQMKQYKFEDIDLVIVNFYPFEFVLSKTNSFKKIIEQIDIGGPSLVRAAAKNHEKVTVISSIDQYQEFVTELNKYKGTTSYKYKKRLSEEAFIETSYYDAIIANYFKKQSKNYFTKKQIVIGNKIENLRYGENPHQNASIYSTSIENKINQVSGKKLSYNNYNDLISAISISKLLPNNIGTVIVKHSNPSGVSIKKNNLESYKMAYNCDPISAFGGIVSCNFKIGKSVAYELSKKFYEIIVGKKFSKDALKILKTKQNLILIDSSQIKFTDQIEINTKLGSLFAQTTDLKPLSKKDFITVSRVKPNKQTLENLLFAFNICRFVKSNAIVITNDLSTVGIGSGQTSRVDSCEIAVSKMRKFMNINNKSNIYAASDAFFPFVDGIEKLVNSGVKAIIQPSGSIRDKEIIKFANKLGIVLVFSKKRHFKH